jgi:hypothetical protein
LRRKNAWLQQWAAQALQCSCSRTLPSFLSYLE